MENTSPNIRLYTMDHPALPPLASGLEEPLAAGSVLPGTPVHTKYFQAASVQHHHREALMKTGLANADEVVESEQRKIRLAADPGIAVPPLPAGDAGLQNILEQMQRNHETEQLNHAALIHRMGELEKKLEGRMGRLEEELEDSIGKLEDLIEDYLGKLDL